MKLLVFKTHTTTAAAAAVAAAAVAAAAAAANLARAGIFSAREMSRLTHCVRMRKRARERAE